MKILFILWFLFIASNVVWGASDKPKVPLRADSKSQGHNASMLKKYGPNETKGLKRSPLGKDAVKEILLKRYAIKYKSNKDLVKLQKLTLMYKGKSVPALIEVMKSSKYPDKNRWIATFLLGKIMGKRSIPFVGKFLNHPSWVMRLASLKTLLALGARSYATQYGVALKDKSYLVRNQALDNISRLNLTRLAPNVWQMLYDKSNYYEPKDKVKKRTNIMKKVVKTIGVLKFEKAKAPLLKMVQKKRYEDIFDDISNTLEKLTGKDVPTGNKNVKRRFWSRVAINNKTI